MFIIGRIFVTVLKYVIHRPRPIEASPALEAFSFPSGHATMSALTFGVVAVLVSHSMGRWGRSIVISTCGIMVIAIAYSRVYLGVHWLSDVLGGLLFGTIMAAAFAVTIEAIPPRRIRPLGLFGATLITFILTGATHIAWHYPAAEQLYATHQRIERIDVARWQEQDWRKLPARRIDLAGRPEELFLVQWAGSLEPLRNLLAAAGWIDTPKWTWRESLPYLNPNADLADLLPRPALHEGLKAKLTLTRPIAGDARTREVIRAFKTNVELSDEGRTQPIYLISVAREQLRRGFNLYAVPSAAPAADGESENVLATLVSAKMLRVLAENQAGSGPQALILARP